MKTALFRCMPKRGLKFQGKTVPPRSSELALSMFLSSCKWNRSKILRTLRHWSPTGERANTRFRHYWKSLDFTTLCGIPFEECLNCKILLYIASKNCLCADEKINSGMRIWRISKIQTDAATTRFTFLPYFLPSWFSTVSSISWVNMSLVTILNLEKLHCLRFYF